MTSGCGAISYTCYPERALANREITLSTCRNKTAAVSIPYS